MKLAFVFLLILFSISASAQKEIKLEELSNHIGDSIKVRGKVYGVRYLQSANNTPTFINIGDVYPNQLPSQPSLRRDSALTKIQKPPFGSS